MYPAGSVLIGTSVAPGDHIVASVTRSGSSYSLKVTDTTTSGNDVSTTQSCSTSTCLDTSAEWIEERPSLRTGIAPLATTARFTMYGAAETGGGTKGNIGSVNPNEVDMVDSTSTYQLATVGALNSSSNAFQDTWKNNF